LSHLSCALESNTYNISISRHRLFQDFRASVLYTNLSESGSISSGRQRAEEWKRSSSRHRQSISPASICQTQFLFHQKMGMVSSSRSAPAPSPIHSQPTLSVKNEQWFSFHHGSSNPLPPFPSLFFPAHNLKLPPMHWMRFEVRRQFLLVLHPHRALKIFLDELFPLLEILSSDLFLFLDLHLSSLVE
jgi:hypothetical protein